MQLLLNDDDLHVLLLDHVLGSISLQDRCWAHEHHLQKLLELAAHSKTLMYAVVVLVGNKTDLAEDRVVSEAEGQLFASSQGMLYVETSAKTAANTSELFESVARQIARSNSAGAAQQPLVTTAASAELPASQATL